MLEPEWYEHSFTPRELDLLGMGLIEMILMVVMYSVFNSFAIV